MESSDKYLQPIQIPNTELKNFFFFQIQEFDLILIAVDRMLPLRFNTIK